MSKTINWYEEHGKDSFIAWFLTHATTTKDHDIDEFGPFPEKAEKMVVEMKINGIEVDPIKVMNDMWESFERMVKKEAYELIEEKFSNISWLLEDFESKIKNELDKGDLE